MKPWARGIISSALATALSLSLAFAPSHAMGRSMPSSNAALFAAQRTESEIDAVVGSALAAGTYVEGEAIVCWLDGDANGLETQADTLLASSEPLSQVSVRQYAEATGDPIPAPGLTTQSEDAPVRIALVRADGMSTEQLMRELLRDPQVLSAEPNFLMGFEEDDVPDTADHYSEDQPTLTPTDEPPTPAVQSDETHANASHDLTGYQWFSEGIDAAVPQYPDLATPNPGVHAPSWNEPGTTNASGVVAIMDSGVDYTHPDLAGVMYHFSPELQAELGCGEFGYAPARDDKTDPMDGLNHGTHCAGIVAAEWNDFGVSGIASGVKLVAVSVSRSPSDANYSYDSIIKGYDFLIRATEAGVDIRSVNRSLGMDPANNANEVMVRAAGEAGIVTCHATGNEHLDLEDRYTDSGLSQPNPYLLRVNASNPQDRRAPFSNYGRYVTDLFAPGTSILSTVPSTMEAENCYFPQADGDPLYAKTDFTDTLDVFPGEELQVAEAVHGNIGVDGDDSSEKVHIITQSGAYATACIDVPVGALSRDDVQDIALAFNVGENEARYPGISVLLEDGTYADDSTPGVREQCDSGPNGWCFCRLHISDPSALPADFAYENDSSGNACIRLSIAFRPYTTSYEPDVTIETGLYIDQIVLGKSGNDAVLPYRYMTGTSMATPVATACAAIVSSSLDSTDPATRAAQTVRMLKGAVRQADGYVGYCKQNGQLDLRLLGNEDSFVPVVESAKTEDDRLVVEGAYLSSGGTLLVGGTEVEVLSWSDGKIVATWPKGLPSGLIPLAVRTDTGAETCRAFIIEAPQDTSGSAPLYEQDLTPVNVRSDGTSATAIPQTLAATEDGILYAAPADSDDRPYAATRHLMCSTDHGLSWDAIDLPTELKSVSIAAGGGKVYMLGGTPANRGYGQDFWELYCYDPSTREFELLAKHDAHGGTDDTFCSHNGSLAYAAGQLYYLDCYEDIDAYNEPTHIRIRRFNAETGLLDGAVLLSHDYARAGFLTPPKIAVAGDGIYVGNMRSDNPSKEPEERLVGLERIDVGADGSLACTDLSSTLYALGDDVGEGDFCIAAYEEGVFLIGANLDALLPPGADRTDTFLLKNGASSFEPYVRTLSFAPFTTPVGVCADGVLYAYGVSKYEGTPLFGRATRVSDQKPEPEPYVPDDPGEPGGPVNPDAWGGTATPGASSKGTPTTRTALRANRPLPRTDDVSGTFLCAAMALAIAGITSITFGLRRLRNGQ